MRHICLSRNVDASFFSMHSTNQSESGKCRQEGYGTSTIQAIYKFNLALSLGKLLLKRISIFLVHIWTLLESDLCDQTLVGNFGTSRPKSFTFFASNHLKQFFFL